MIFLFIVKRAHVSRQLVCERVLCLSKEGRDQYMEELLDVFQK